jgi:ABC-type multidrug transport system fused ATPase/permease subunit
MARPPGKRNSTISQLSGGEKALTAVALVFAIFDLNPAPFCLLDEVDAPLDENNVGRFCDIVRDMSRNVQFIFITHNKSTMELASQLVGVTMNEPCHAWSPWMSMRPCAWRRCRAQGLGRIPVDIAGVGPVVDRRHLVVGRAPAGPRAGQCGAA